MKRLNILPFVLLVVLSSLWMGATLIAAQDATPETTEPSPIVLPILENLPSAEPDLSTYPVTVENCGRELTFDAPPERVISLWQPPTEMLLALGISDRFVALAGTYTTYPDVFADTVAAIPSIGSGMFWPSREILLSYEPDFVISEGLDSFGYDASFGYATVEEIEASGAIVYASAACSYANPEETPRNIDRVLNDIRTLGTIFGVSERAEALIERMEAQRQTVVEAVQGREPVRVAFYNGGEGPLFVLNSSMWADLLVTAGGESVFDASAFQVSVEEFAAADPEVILMGVYPGQSAEDLTAFLQTTFPTASAVQNGRLYPVETISVENSIRIMYGLETIARALHPDAFANEPSASLAAAVQTHYPVTIETCGRTITVAAPPQRVYTT
jgi:iron complex transport system substrate-binding protein